MKCSECKIKIGYGGLCSRKERRIMWGCYEKSSHFRMKRQLKEAAMLTKAISVPAAESWILEDLYVIKKGIFELTYEVVKKIG